MFQIGCMGVFGLCGMYYACSVCVCIKQAVSMWVGGDNFRQLMLQVVVKPGVEGEPIYLYIKMFHSKW